MIRNFINDESGQGMVEYILIIALIAIAVIASVRLFGDKIRGFFSKASDKIQDETDTMSR
ncbi:MAG: Flp family type IVb pilin [Endomicrobiales bacterium]|nr:Flp family type IVb pilin [Endomicrobiales bacterium]